MKSKNLLLTALLSSLLVLSACASKEKAPAEPVVQAPPSPYDNDEQILIDSLKQSFTAGNYRGVIDMVNKSSLTESGSLAFRTQALKYKAFAQCSLKQTKSCAVTFRNLLKTNPNFELVDTEKNHPIWGKVFEREFKRHQKNSEAAKSKTHKKK